MAPSWVGLKRRQGRPSLWLLRASARAPGRACGPDGPSPPRPRRARVARPNGRRRSLAGPYPKMVGLGRLERPTSPLSGVRSNHLSYRPVASHHLGSPKCLDHQSAWITKSAKRVCAIPDHAKMSGRRKRNEDGGYPAKSGLTDPLCSKEIR
jgi:hypothetical protein